MCMGRLIIPGKRLIIPGKRLIIPGKRSVGGPALTYVDVLCKDTGLSVADLRNLMADRELWETVRTSSSKEEML